MTDNDAGLKNYFYVSKKVIDVFLNANVSAEYILVYLVLARFSYGKSNESTKLQCKAKILDINRGSGGYRRFSLLRDDRRPRHRERKWITPDSIAGTYLFRMTNASAKAVEKYTGIRRHRAQQIIADLCAMRTCSGKRLLFSTDEWNRYAKEKWSDAKPGNSFKIVTLPVIKNEGEYEEVARYVLNSFDEYSTDQVRLPNELVTGAKTKSAKGVLKTPLKTLYRIRQHKDEAVRLLLAAYLYRFPREKIVDPYNGFAYDYDCEKIVDVGNATFWKTVHSRFTIAPELFKRITKHSDLSPEDVLEQLAKYGFLCCDVVICRPGMMGDKIWYVLSAKVVGSFFRKNDSAMASYIENIFRSRGHKVAQTYGKSYRFNDTYPVVGPRGGDVDVKGVFSLRIDVGAPKAWHSIKQGELSKSILSGLILPQKRLSTFFESPSL